MRAREVEAAERRRQREVDDAKDERVRAIVLLIRDALIDEVGPIGDYNRITIIALNLALAMRDKGLLT